ncbi:LacI family transcriptional regulator [Aestuariivirga sp.]|uniref:LacI family transcriptional regulator n=1 Tax=Aestuariivirga sp. TaxID=2650926 RepID=UPI0039E5BEA4
MNAWDKPPTLRNLAARLGLGVSTVSQALRDSPEIAVETRRRVKQAAEQLGYVPNRAGVRLRTGKTNIISLVLNPEDDGSGFFTNMIYGIADALAQTPYHLVVTPSTFADPMAPIRHIAETHAADGVIISRIMPDDPRVRYLHSVGLPFATHGRTDIGIDHCYYDYDNHAYVMEALRQLKARGRQRVVLFGPPPGLAYAQHTLAGFVDGLQAHAMQGKVVTTAHSDSDFSHLQQTAHGIATSPQAPDAVICSSPSEAIAVASGMAKAGFVMGRTYDLVVKPISKLAKLALPQIIGIEEDHRAAGRELARMLLALIDGEDASKLQMLVAPHAS